MTPLILIPTYNEEKNIIPLCKKIFEQTHSADILFIDDNSSDGTRANINLMENEYSGRVFLLKRPHKMGLASAYLDGFKWGLKNEKYDGFLEMDADFSHNPDNLPTIFHEGQTYDFVIGSRYVPGGAVKNWSLLRRLISRGGSLYARTILRLKIYDLTGGFNFWSRKIISNFMNQDIKSKGYAFQIELKYRADKQGYSWKEVPITFEDRTVGESKMSKFIVLEAVFRVWQLLFISK